MKDVLKEKILHNGRLAQELERSEGFQEILKRSAEKKEQLLKEVIGSKTFDEVRYKAGFIEGLEFSKIMTDQWSQREKKLRKRG